MSRMTRTIYIWLGIIGFLGGSFFFSLIYYAVKGGRTENAVVCAGLGIICCIFGLYTIILGKSEPGI